MINKEEIVSVEKHYSAMTCTFTDYKVTFNTDKVAFVPLETANTDYLTILEWVADGNTIAEEAAWGACAFDRAISKLREKRNSLLFETDFYALLDVTMSEDMTTYRQELRDLPSGLSTVEDVNNVTYPTKP